MKRYLLGIGISLLVIIWVLRGVDWRLISASMGKVQWAYVFLYIPLLLFIQFLRSFRWQVLLQPLMKTGQKTLFPITCLGCMGILILPARSGELIRPYFLSKQEAISMSAALATIVVERVLDVLIVLAFFIVLGFSDIMPLWVRQAGYMTMALVGGIVLFLFLLIGKESWVMKVAERILARFPKRISESLRNFMLSFSQGSRILIHGWTMAKTFFLSFAIWFGVGLLNYIMFLAFSFSIPWVAAFVLVIILDLGLMIPAAPGFVGTFQFFCVLSLAIFGVNREEALSFSIVSHFLQILCIVALGLFFLPNMKAMRLARRSPFFSPVRSQDPDTIRSKP